MKNKILVVFAVCLLWACSKLDDANIALPEVNYKKALTATFFKAGQSETPEVKWNGDNGKFGFKEGIKGVTIDSQTGVISWHEKLPIGSTQIDLIVFNKAGVSSKIVTLENNNVNGDFKGEHEPAIFAVYNTNRVIQFSFNTDGTFSGYWQETKPDETLTEPSNFDGTYEIVNGEIQGQFKYLNYPNTTHYLFASIHYNQNGVRLAGRYSDKPEVEDIIFSEFDTSLVMNNN